MEKFNKICDLLQSEKNTQISMHLELSSLEGKDVLWLQNIALWLSRVSAILDELERISEQKVHSNLSASRMIEEMVDNHLLKRKALSETLKNEI